MSAGDRAGFEALENDLFGSYQIASECLCDEQRTELFERAITSLVRPGDVVIDAGTGTGVLAMFAVRAGASRVYAIEVSGSVLRMAMRNWDENALGARIRPVNRNVLKLRAGELEPARVLVMEMVSTGLIEELQVPAFNQLLGQGLVQPEAVVIPSSFRTTVQLVDFDFDFYGFKTANPIHTESWQRPRISAGLSEPQLVSEVDFEAHRKGGVSVECAVETTVSLTATASGRANALLFASTARLSPEIELAWTDSINVPFAVPLAPAISVRPGQRSTFEISYQMGAGLDTLKVRAASDSAHR